MKNVCQKDFEIGKIITFENSDVMLKNGDKVFVSDSMDKLRIQVESGNIFNLFIYERTNNNFLHCKRYDVYRHTYSYTDKKYGYKYCPNLVPFSPDYPWDRYLNKTVSFKDEPEKVFVVTQREVIEGKVYITTPRGVKSAEELLDTLEFVYARKENEPFGVVLTKDTLKYFRG